MALQKATAICQVDIPRSVEGAHGLLDVLGKIIPLIYNHISDRGDTAIFGLRKGYVYTGPIQYERPLVAYTYAPGEIRRYSRYHEGQQQDLDEEKDCESSAAASGSVICDIVRDGFRLLLAAYSAKNLSMFQSSAILMKLLYTLPEFSCDLILFVREGRGLNVNEDGLLTMSFEMAELSTSLE
ncbi:hypothetical protein TWF481_009268 [Arthrobotrys musiformis]|uniref:Uncharacterized protein n=1 Tax=Arthrobotrys musiformis TaxID=47236 RepID=A0AAV9W588_9PEZI